MLALDISEFIQKYFYVVIGVVFFIFKMFGGSKPKKGNSMPTFGGGTEQSNRDQHEHGYDEDDDHSRQRYDDDNSVEQRRRAELQRLQEEEMNRERQLQRADQLREEQRMRYEQQQRLQQAAAKRQAQQSDLSTDYFAQNELGGESQATQAVDSFSSRENTLHSSALKANELRKAVLWSEVLGAPRAKRPYRR